MSSFGAVNPDPSSDPNDQSPAPTNLLGILLGTGVAAVVVVALTTVIATTVVVYRRRQRRHRTLGVSVGVSLDTEKTRLIFS